MPWGSPKAAQGSCRFGCVLVQSRKAAPPLPSFIYQAHNPLNHNFTSTRFSFSLDIPDSGPDPFTTPWLLPEHHRFNQSTYTQLAVFRTRSPDSSPLSSNTNTWSPSPLQLVCERARSTWKRKHIKSN
ncbi:hypothetical protein FJTKL_11141 [Diaporthe vaccinii]|uniref:Uncharacterized protein n=1 Tax=Diaporthe vaccinii TaxID=105482 RepID=A0ABR4EIF1_9PEZI